MDTDTKGAALAALDRMRLALYQEYGDEERCGRGLSADAALVRSALIAGDS